MLKENIRKRYLQKILENLFSQVELGQLKAMTQIIQRKAKIKYQLFLNHWKNNKRSLLNWKNRLANLVAVLAKMHLNLLSSNKKNWLNYRSRLKILEVILVKISLVWWAKSKLSYIISIAFPICISFVRGV